MKLIKLIINATFVLILSTSCSTSQSNHLAANQPKPGPGSDYMVHEYLQVTGTKANMMRYQKLMLGQMRGTLERLLAEQMNKRHFDDPSKRDQAVLVISESISNVLSRYEKELQELMPFEEVEKRIITPVIRKHFTDDELSALISFYKSPVGKKYVASFNAITQEILDRTNQAYGQQLHRLSKTIAEEEIERIGRQLSHELK
jgi:uncharacterized protein